MSRVIGYLVATVIMCGWGLPAFAYLAFVLFRWAMRPVPTETPEGEPRDGS